MLRLNRWFLLYVRSLFFSILVFLHDIWITVQHLGKLFSVLVLNEGQSTQGMTKIDKIDHIVSNELVQVNLLQKVGYFGILNEQWHNYWLLCELEKESDS